jgi:hypothetical protein
MAAKACFHAQDSACRSKMSAAGDRFLRGIRPTRRMALDINDY